MVQVLFGVSEEHYRAQFIAWPKCHNFQNFLDFEQQWPGNIYDFLEAETSGFENALGLVFNIHSINAINMEKYYDSSQIHLL